MKQYIVAVLVRNRSGVLNRVTSMFRRRQFNISALTVSETESPELSRITVLFSGADQTKTQLIVVSIRELSEDRTISSELMLIKVKHSPELREELRTASEAFGATAVDYTRDAITLQLAGESRKLNSFIDLMRDYTILEICRTGVVALERGDAVIGRGPAI